MRKKTALLAAAAFALAGTTALTPTPILAQGTPGTTAPGTTAPTPPSDTKATPNATQPAPAQRDVTAVTAPQITLTSEQMDKLRQWMARSEVRAQAAPNSAGWTVGATVPANVELKAVPAELNLPSAQNYRWVLLENNNLAFVDPQSRRIVQIVPAAGATTAARDAAPTTPSTTGRDTTTTTTTTTTAARDRDAATAPHDPSAFVTSGAANQWMASRLIGMSVYGPNNDRIGEIDDLVVDAGGRVVAAVIGVGGFLGIGEKNVAVAFDRLKPVIGQGERDHVNVQFTKAELEGAPAFRRERNR